MTGQRPRQAAGLPRRAVEGPRRDRRVQPWSEGRRKWAERNGWHSTQETRLLEEKRLGAPGLGASPRCADGSAGAGCGLAAVPRRPRGSVARLPGPDAAVRRGMTSREPFVRGVLVTGASAHVIDRVLASPHVVKVIDSLPPWMRGGVLMTRRIRQPLLNTRPSRLRLSARTNGRKRNRSRLNHDGTNRGDGPRAVGAAGATARQ